MKTLFLLLTGLLFITGCACNCKKPYPVAADGFPNHWWEEVPKEKLAWWEFSPHTASREQGVVMLSKRNELGTLSNFTAAEFKLDGITYGSLEGLWQSMLYPEGKKDQRLKDKTLKWEFTRDQVAKMTAFDAKRAGDLAEANMKKMGITWITYKRKKLDYKGKDREKHYEIILRASRAKLEANPEIKATLLKTKNLKLVPDHAQSPDDPPAWRYFEIYMKIRDELLKKSPA